MSLSLKRPAKLRASWLSPSHQSVTIPKSFRHTRTNTHRIFPQSRLSRRPPRTHSSLHSHNPEPQPPLRPQSQRLKSHQLPCLGGRLLRVRSRVCSSGRDPKFLSKESPLLKRLMTPRIAQLQPTIRQRQHQDVAGRRTPRLLPLAPIPLRAPTHL